MVIDDTLNTGADLVAGDEFAFSFSYDDSSLDDESADSAGFFRLAVLSWTLTRIGGTGLWDPAGGIFNVPSNVDTFDNTGTFQFSTRVSSGFPSINGSGFTANKLQLGGLALNDNGLGESLAQILGGPLPTNLAAFSTKTIFFHTEAGDSNIRASGTITAFSQLPEPGTFGAAAAGLAALLGFARRRRRSLA